MSDRQTHIARETLDALVETIRADSDDPPWGDEDPISVVARWLDEATATGMANPNAMTLATVDEEGRPDARTVLLKGDPSDGFRFFTNRRSPKGRALAVHPDATLLFYWRRLDRQVRVRGPVAPLSPAEDDAYWQTRPPASRLAAAASRQSEALPSRDELAERVAALAAEGDLPRPAHWGGYRVVPTTIELWVARPNRVHVRWRYTRADAHQPWRRLALQP